MNQDSGRPAFLGRGRGRAYSDNQTWEKTVGGVLRGSGESVPRSPHPPVALEDEIEEEQEYGDEVEEILQKLLFSYKKESSMSSNARDVKESPEEDSYVVLKQRMNQVLISSSGSCLICYNVVKKSDPIWSCSQCYCAFHLNCIQHWSRESTSAQMQTVRAKLFPNREITWTCPKCRLEYTQGNIPQKYTCFCGKTVNPPNDPWLVAHSCGDVCGKSLSCGHKCSLLCHPGPCPECPKMVSVGCYCGRSGPKMRRCGFKGWSCGRMCRKVLTCKLHVCEENCHDGDCAPCTYDVEMKCVCGRESKTKPCGTVEWSCQKVCGKKLPCGHSCDKVCHKGSCGECPRGSSISCPCGKTKYSDLLCTEDPPVCGDTCGKQLACGEHLCMQRCHYGPCGVCRILCTKRCRCGKHEKTAPCSQDYLCDSKCGNYRNCGRHQCKRKCCDGQCLPCEQVCNKRLSCRQHKCAAPCHVGPCYPCSLTEVVQCACGAAKITVPCGCGRETKSPPCKELCRRPPLCNHKERKPHRCHFGSCPKCQKTCNKELKCGHSCRFPCHSEPVTIVTQQPLDALAPLSKRPPPTEKVVVEPCPPCVHLVHVMCYGKHESTEMKCSEVRGYSCARECGRNLRCGNHTCQKECHVVTNPPNDVDAGDDCDICEEPCTKPRPPGCTHTCPLPCHQGPCPSCIVQMKLRCHCDLCPIVVKCSEWNAVTEEKQNELLSCSGVCPKLLPCGHRCPLICHPGVCKAVCKKHVTIRCHCKRLKKEVRCCDVKRTTLDCDKECDRIKEEQLAKEREEERRRQDEEERLKEEEKETRQRLLQGRRKKRKKKPNVVEDHQESMFSWFTLKRVSFVVSLILFIVMVCLICAILVL